MYPMPAHSLQRDVMVTLFSDTVSIVPSEIVSKAPSDDSCFIFGRHLLAKRVASVRLMVPMLEESRYNKGRHRRHDAVALFSFSVPLSSRSSFLQARVERKQQKSKAPPPRGSPASRYYYHNVVVDQCHPSRVLEKEFPFAN